ncbi:diaminopimelate epimerase [Archaeoglobus veneficus]|uniref:Diaminopimelate epimerase n=1 Tax=Archaeoglobus veneficus (strain DSM 11195 / SNP6) TaxID=693661 RepID=F2KSG1_ARCVS|nr:diaminopimelate epimerase [Archaeoglobus veneficus]AEA46930.1 Diaminopimelate epimerase [Archaeoglobus veneficus SNP6]
MFEGLEFTKMHGNGNDFVVVDEFHEEVVPEEHKPQFVRAVCKPRFGVGADGAIFVQPSSVADAKFRYFNSDGSEAAMCGNGIRCFARYVVEEGYADRRFKAETLAGIKELEVSVKDGEYWVRVDMGKPVFEPAKIPAAGGTFDGVWHDTFELFGRKVDVYAVNTGVPHAVVFVDSLDFDILEARKIRYNKAFPEGTNVNFARIVSRNEVEVRTYERGVEDETLSCGTGSVAVVAVASKLGLIEPEAIVKTKGGVLRIEVRDTAFMTGKATRVFDGVLKEL